MSFEIVQLDETTWSLEDGFVRCFLLAGTKEALLIDSGATTPNAKLYAESLTKLPVKLLNTHGDGDHTAGNAAFSQVMMHPADYQNCAMAKTYPSCRCVPVSDLQVLDLGDRPLEILLTPGHTKGSISVLDLHRKTLYPGDMVQDGTIFLYGSHRAPEALADSLGKLESIALYYDTIHPCHGSLTLPADAVQKVAADWQAVCEGTLPYTESTVYGTEVREYRGSFCSFYCEKE